MNSNNGTSDCRGVALTDDALDDVCGGKGKLGWVLTGLQALYEVGSAVWDAAKNSKGGYPDGERTDVMGNQG